jgi:thiamine-phosphate pyrophosphorylase
MLKGLYGITSDQLLNLSENKILDGIEASCSAGLNILQYRQKTSNKISLTCLKAIQNICTQYQTTFIINDAFELARSINADGVHLGKNDASLSNIRKTMGEDFIIGASCYNSLNLAIDAQKKGASYVAFGAMFKSTTKPDAPIASIETLKKAKEQLTVPVCAIGGIQLSNISLIKTSHADMVAIVSEIFNSPDIFWTTKQLKKAFLAPL